MAARSTSFVDRVIISSERVQTFDAKNNTFRMFGLDDDVLTRRDLDETCTSDR